MSPLTDTQPRLPYPMGWEDFMRQWRQDNPISYNTLRDVPELKTYNASAGQVSISQTAAVSISLGIRERTASLAGTIKGERYMAFCRSYSLNGGATVDG